MDNWFDERNDLIVPNATYSMKRNLNTLPRVYIIYIHWIGLRENLQETMVFTLKYGSFWFKKSLNPIH